MNFKNIIPMVVLLITTATIASTHANEFNAETHKENCQRVAYYSPEVRHLMPRVPNSDYVLIVLMMRYPNEDAFFLSEIVAVSYSQPNIGNEGLEQLFYSMCVDAGNIMYEGVNGNPTRKELKQLLESHYGYIEW